MRLAVDVPMGDVDGCNGMHADAGLAARDQRPVEPVPDAVIIERVHANDLRRGDGIDSCLDRNRRPDRGDAVSGDPGIGFDLDNTGLMRGCLGRAGDVQLDLQQHGMGSNGSDLHGDVLRPGQVRLPNPSG